MLSPVPWVLGVLTVRWQGVDAFGIDAFGVSVQRAMVSNDRCLSVLYFQESLRGNPQVFAHQGVPDVLMDG